MRRERNAGLRGALRFRRERLRGPLGFRKRSFLDPSAPCFRKHPGVKTGDLRIIIDEYVIGVDVNTGD